MAQDVFQKKIDLTYEGLPGVDTIVDDILVYSKDRKDHDAKLDAVLCRTQEQEIRLNPDKCVFQPIKSPTFDTSYQLMAFDLTR